MYVFVAVFSTIITGGIIFATKLINLLMLKIGLQWIRFSCQVCLEEGTMG